jgi:molybdopterin synthase sulfur carrier subunit
MASQAETGGDAVAVKVRIPTPLLRFTAGKEEVQCKAGTVIDLINDLNAQYPGIGERITENEKVMGFVNIYVNDNDIRFMQLEMSLVKDGDEVSIIPAIAGGRV